VQEAVTTSTRLRARPSPQSPAGRRSNRRPAQHLSTAHKARMREKGVCHHKHKTKSKGYCCWRVSTGHLRPQALLDWTGLPACKLLFPCLRATRGHRRCTGLHCLLCVSKLTFPALSESSGHLRPRTLSANSQACPRWCVYGPPAATSTASVAAAAASVFQHQRCRG
jgi:hypothetical protein